MDIATDNFMQNMKLDFLGRGIPGHKLYVYFTGTGTNGAPAAFSGSNDTPYGINTAIFDFGAILHEMGHACYPRTPDKDRTPGDLRTKCAGDFWFDPKNRAWYHHMMMGESLVANFFGWYCFLSMIEAEPNHPLLKSSLGICEYSIQEHFALRSQLAFDATFYVMPLWKPEIDGIDDGTRDRLGRETYSNGLSMPLLKKIEDKYGSRYSTNYPIVYLYRKFGIKFVVALMYHICYSKCLVKTICYLLGNNSSPHDFMLEYAIDWVFQAFATGESGEMLKRKKVPYRYSKNLKWSKNVNDPLEWKGFEVFDVREMVKTTEDIYFEFIANAHPDDWRFAFAQGLPVSSSNGYSDVNIIRQQGAKEGHFMTARIKGSDPAYLILVAGGVTHTDSMPGYIINVRTVKTGTPVATIKALPGKRPEEQLAMPPLKDFIKNPGDYDPPACRGLTVPNQACIESLWKEYGCTEPVPKETYKNKVEAMRRFASIIAGTNGNDIKKCLGGYNPCRGYTKDQIPSKNCIRRMWHRAGCTRMMPEKIYPVDMGYNPGLQLYSSLPLSQVEQNLKDLMLFINPIKDQFGNVFPAGVSGYEPARAFACKADMSEHITVSMDIIG